MELLANATLQTDIELLTTVGHMVDEQVRTLAEALASLTASVRLLACVSMLVLQQI